MNPVKNLCVLPISLLLISGCSRPRGEYVESTFQEYHLSRSPRTSALPDTQQDTEARLSGTGAAKGRANWLKMGDRLGQRDDTSQLDEARGEQQFVPWRKRRGAAYPADFWRSFGRDAKEFPATVWDDTVATFTNGWALVGLGGAVGSGIALDASNANGCVADHYRKHRSQLNSFWDSVGDVGGNPGLHFAVAGAMYFNSLYHQDVRNYEVSKTLLNALAVNGIVTMALKGIAHSDSPNGDPWGWPSGHTSSTFCFATVMHEEYGPWVGVPLYAFAAFVGYERIDARNHDLNDVISGALIGIAIGHAVYHNHQPRIFGMDVIPWVDPEKGSLGVALEKRW